MDREASDRNSLRWPILLLSVVGVCVTAASAVMQFQQQTFDRFLSKTENGYRYYFEQRTALRATADVSIEQALLEFIGRAYPNVYCDARKDLYTRLSNLELNQPASSADAFGLADRDLLIAYIESNPGPKVPPLTSNLFQLQDRVPTRCAALFATEEERPSVDNSPAEPPSNRSPSSRMEATQVAPPATQHDSEPLPDVRDTSTTGADRSTAPPAAHTPDSRPQQDITYQVQLSLAPERWPDNSVADRLRSELAPYNFRIARTVERERRDASRGTVSYYGAGQREVAEFLAARLNELLALEEVEFRTEAIGSRYRLMPRTLIQVWIP